MYRITISFKFTFYCHINRWFHYNYSIWKRSFEYQPTIIKMTFYLMFIHVLVFKSCNYQELSYLLETMKNRYQCYFAFLLTDYHHWYHHWYHHFTLFQHKFYRIIYTLIFKWQDIMYRRICQKSCENWTILYHVRFRI